jgi:hypothetical protein
MDYPTAIIEYAITINNNLRYKKRKVLALAKAGSPDHAGAITFKIEVIIKY